MKLYTSLISYSLSVFFFFSLCPTSLSISRTNLGNAHPKNPAGDLLHYIAGAPNTRVIVHHLALPVMASLSQGAIDPGHICGNRQGGVRLLHRGLGVSLIAVDPGAIQAADNPFAFQWHFHDVGTVATMVVVYNA